MKLSWKYYGHKTSDFVEHLLTLTSGAASAFEKRHLFIVSSCSRPKKWVTLSKRERVYSIQSPKRDYFERRDLNFLLLLWSSRIMPSKIFFQAWQKGWDWHSIYFWKWKCLQGWYLLCRRQQLTYSCSYRSCWQNSIALYWQHKMGA